MRALAKVAELPVLHFDERTARRRADLESKEDLAPDGG